MDVRFELNGATFVWDEAKARANVVAHDGITFECAVEVFFDPFFRLVMPVETTKRETRPSAMTASVVFIFVVHIEFDGEHIRIISARKATSQEREDHDS